MDQYEIMELFFYGSISRIRVDKDGVGFISFRNKSSAEDAIAASLDPSFGISIDSNQAFPGPQALELAVLFGVDDGISTVLGDTEREERCAFLMAMQAENPAVIPSAQIVGNAFVEQYYQILHQTPELVYRFYQDSSVLSRSDPNGVMACVMTMQGINEKIMSLDYKDYIAEIKTADAQQSLGGVTVLVTGYLTGMDKVRKKFVQSFFLAPQEKGFFVLNDVFRYVDDDESTEVAPVSDG